MDIYDKRLTELNDRPVDGNGDCVIYWMQRSQRAFDNLALEFAVNLANDLGKPVLTYFGLYDRYPMASVRAFKFMLEGLRQTAAELESRGIGFLMRREPPAEGIVGAARELRACAVVVDEDYLNLGRAWRSKAARDLDVRLYQIDAETIVPARVSDKEEWGAYTIRPKILKLLPECFREFPQTDPAHPWRTDPGTGIDIAALDPLDYALSLDVDQQIAPLTHITGGHTPARKRMERFIGEQLADYAALRNEIGADATSGISPYLHFGQLSALRAALMVEQADAPEDSVDAFLEQIIVRRELAINFCLHNPLYDTVDAAADWARRSLEEHRNDERGSLYTLEDLESAASSDDLWNAAQTELVNHGRIHGYMRMVWAKSLIGWSATPEEALARAIYLNDKYALDGRDPNGYANIAWCILGKHDRPFPDRPIFGKIRYMSTAATRRKTDWQAYVAQATTGVA